MPSRVERLTIRWLLRVTLLATVSLAAYSLWTQKKQQEALLGEVEKHAGEIAGGIAVSGAEIASETQGVGESPQSHAIENKEKGVALELSTEGQKTRGNALVIASLKHEDTSWLEGILPDWERAIYVSDGEALEDGGKQGLRIPKNKGREGMVYLRYVTSI